MTALPRKPSSMASRKLRGELSDAELLQEIAAGDLTALGLLYDRYAHDVRCFARRATLDPDDGDDVVHEVFLTVMKVASSYDGRTLARPFLIGITAQLLRRRRRALGRLAEVLVDFARAVVAPAPRTPEEVTSVDEELRLFERALARLSEEKRLVFLMIEGEGVEGEKVAQILGIPVATVRTRLHHARKEIRAAMGRGTKS
jgi:RNA polymerase sigma-70 factor (ECF subfamily)